MKLIRFDARKLPFKPIEKQVIYFDASILSQKLSYGVGRLVDTQNAGAHDVFLKTWRLVQRSSLHEENYGNQVPGILRSTWRMYFWKQVEYALTKSLAI